MTSLFRNETGVVNMELFDTSSFFVVGGSRMSFQPGEGGEEIGNHGGSTANRFSQETEAQGQQGKPRMGIPWPTLKRLKCRTHADTLTQLPFFLFFSQANIQGHQDV